MSRLATPYLPRRPQETVLYGLVKEHWRDFVQHARETYEARLPKYVVDKFQKYLACGDFAEGFVHVQCASCGDDLAVAFSCKVRGLCPSCAGRRMAGFLAVLTPIFMFSAVVFRDPTSRSTHERDAACDVPRAELALPVPFVGSIGDEAEIERC